MNHEITDNMNSKFETKNLNSNENNIKVNNFIEDIPKEQNLKKNTNMVFPSTQETKQKKDLFANTNFDRIHDAKSKNIEFGIIFWLKSMICTPSDKTGKKKVKILNDIMGFLNQRMDFLVYFKMQYSIDLANSLLFNSTQKKILDFAANPNVLYSEDINLYGLNKKIDDRLDYNEILNYYIEKKNENTLNDYDHGLIQILPERVKQVIENDS